MQSRGRGGTREQWQGSRGDLGRGGERMTREFYDGGPGEGSRGRWDSEGGRYFEGDEGGGGYGGPTTGSRPGGYDEDRDWGRDQGGTDQEWSERGQYGGWYGSAPYANDRYGHDRDDRYAGQPQRYGGDASRSQYGRGPNPGGPREQYRGGRYEGGQYGGGQYGGGQYGGGQYGGGQYGGGQYGGGQQYGGQQYGGGQRYGSGSFDGGQYDGQQRTGHGKGPKNFTRSDERIREAVCEALEESHVDASNIEVTVKDGEVTLEGFVEHRGDKRDAEECTCAMRGVKECHNRLRTGSASSTTSTAENGQRATPVSSTSRSAEARQPS